METRLVGPAHNGDSVHVVARSYCALLTTRHENAGEPYRIFGYFAVAVLMPGLQEVYDNLKKGIKMSVIVKSCNS